MVQATSTQISCLIVDDEEPAHEVLRFLISKVPWLVNLGSSYNSIEALEFISEHRPNVIFLDVNMPELSGIDLLKILEAPDSHVIMTTAYPEYAIEGFNFDVASFLLKPIGFDRFLKAVTKVRRIMGMNASVQNRILISDIDTSEPEVGSSSLSGEAARISNSKGDINLQEDYIWVRANRKIYCVWYKDIYFIEGLKDYIKIYYTDGVLTTLASMTKMENRLPSPPFVRTHRSYLVNRTFIKVIDGNIITMQNDMKVTIAASPSRDDIYRKLIENYNK